jgi:oxygen-independent coproporphyrinogen-3 oxidase
MNGIYIHVPFCVKKCRYCDFFSVTDLGDTDAFVRALGHEIKQVSESEPVENKLADTVYLGGGTPSILDLHQLETIFSSVSSAYTLTRDAEITVEVNPGTVSPEKLDGMRTIGVNRLSIGIQSFQDSNLSFLGRIHTAEQGLKAVEMAYDHGFNNVGIDLIYGLPGQNHEGLGKDLRAALALNPAHISCYMLGIEEGTPLFMSLNKGEFSPLPEENSADLFTFTSDVLSSAGYIHYEISNFSRSWETRSRHNSRYWDFLPYRGFGPSAHSYLPWKDERYWNVSDLHSYLEKVTAGVSPIDDRETLNREQKIMEAVYIGLRKKDGIDLKDFEVSFGIDFLKTFGPPLSGFFDQGLANISENRLSLTRKGMLFADHIASALIGHLS